MQRAEREGDLGKASELKYGEIPALRKEAEALRGNIPDGSPGDGRVAPPHIPPAGGRRLKEGVDEEDIAQVVSRWTGIPVSRLVEGEVEKLVRMEERLGQRVVGQDDAIRLVSNAVRRAKS